jgi:topoisomerase-4 subunit B
MAPTTRRLIQLQLDGRNKAEKTLDLLLARKRSGDRKLWLGEKGDQADVG